ncbi:GDP-mannose golgi apparatus [Micractinium conductrix]|uniref:GDP-mannose golgi apparatus n=1 Tax=Micractinium conductrix TaxID=554055 RepID=A0A2P6VS47_9CHLO|nr:GDP-mannose golgi apparatus [Micractinium conductrix]|eukprot:PSC76911.1 GDP-mannose golgi apparatus [Micractinium conductrix]
MIGTGFWSLKTLNVAMVQVLKNLTNLLVLAGDWFLYRRSYRANVWGCVGLMMVSALLAAATDLTFNAAGYLWQAVNNCFTAGYTLYLRGAMDRAARHTSDGQRLGEFSMVFYNNLLSLPLIGMVVASTGEARAVGQEPALRNPAFLLVALLSGVLTFALSFASLSFLATTTPSIYSLVGSLTKVPLSIIGLLAFNVPWTPPNLVSVLVGCAAGVVFAVVKSRGG